MLSSISDRRYPSYQEHLAPTEELRPGSVWCWSTAPWPCLCCRLHLPQRRWPHPPHLPPPLRKLDWCFYLFDQWIPSMTLLSTIGHRVLSKKADREVSSHRSFSHRSYNLGRSAVWRWLPIIETSGDGSSVFAEVQAGFELRDNVTFSNLPHRNVLAPEKNLCYVPVKSSQWLTRRRYSGVGHDSNSIRPSSS